MNEKMNGGISTMRGIFCRLSFQKGGITAETIVAQGFDGGIFSVDTRQSKLTDRQEAGLSIFLYSRGQTICLSRNSIAAAIFICMTKERNTLFLCVFWIYFLFTLRATVCYNGKTTIHSLQSPNGTRKDNSNSEMEQT